MDRTRALVVRECKELSWRLTERECIEIGRMMGAACEGEQYLNKEMKKARELRAEMSGTKDA